MIEVIEMKPEDFGEMRWPHTGDIITLKQMHALLDYGRKNIKKILNEQTI